LTLSGASSTLLMIHLPLLNAYSCLGFPSEDNLERLGCLELMIKSGRILWSMMEEIN